MWPRDAYVGQRVVCVDGRFGVPDRVVSALGCAFPKKGTVYTIRSVEAFEEGIGLTFVELVNPHVAEHGTCEPTFATAQFKPVDETCLDIFREMLIDNKDLIDA